MSDAIGRVEASNAEPGRQFQRVVARCPLLEKGEGMSTPSTLSRRQGVGGDGRRQRAVDAA